MFRRVSARIGQFVDFKFHHDSHKKAAGVPEESAAEEAKKAEVVEAVNAESEAPVVSACPQIKKVKAWLITRLHSYFHIISQLAAPITSESIGDVVVPSTSTEVLEPKPTEAETAVEAVVEEPKDKPAAVVTPVVAATA